MRQLVLSHRSEALEVWRRSIGAALFGLQNLADRLTRRRHQRRE
jgi:hypothetical protein